VSSSAGAAPATGGFFGATLGATGAALLQVLFAVGGWQNVSAVASEIREPQRTLPRGMLIGTVVVIALYMGVNWAVLSILGVDATAHSKTPAADAAARVVSWGGPLISGLVVLSTAAFVQAILLVTPRIFYAMAEDGAFFRSAARVHPAWKTPWIAIVLQGVFTCGYVLWQQALYLLEVATLCDYIFFTLCALAFFKLRRTRPDLERPYRALGYPWLPGIFLFAAAGVLVNAIVTAQPTAVAIAGGVLALGFVLYAVWRRSPGRAGA
jgi:amino acid transporter